MHFVTICYYKPCYALLLLLWLNSLSTQAQNVAALKKQLSITIADTSKHRLYYELGTSYRAINHDSALYFLQKSLQVAERINNPLLTAKSMYRIGYVYYYDKFNETSALNWLKKCLAIASKSNDHLHIARAYIVMGIISDHQNLAPEELFLKALYHAKIAKEWLTLASCYNTLADIYRKKARWKDAEAMLLNMMAVCEKNNPTYWLYGCIDYCTLLEQRGANNIALEYYKKAELVQQKINKSGETIEGLMQLARLENKLKKIQNSEYYLLKVLNLEQAKAQPDSERINQIYDNLSIAYAGQEKYKQAYETKQQHFEMHFSIKTKAHQESSELQMTRFQATVEKEKQKTEIALLETQTQQQLFFLVAAIILAILLISFLIFLQRNKKRVERQKIELGQLNATKDKLFAILSHDLRSPVASLKNYMMLIKWGALSQTEFAESAQGLNLQVSNVHTMLENVLNWSISQMGGMHPKITKTTIFSIIEEQIQLLETVAEAKNILVENQIPPEASLLVDKNHLMIIVRNLLQNALKFTDSGGKITFNFLGKDEKSVIEVKDNGIGMSEEKLINLFQLEKNTFSTGTANEQGTGLGLVLVKDLVEINNGKIIVKSELGKGTIFEVSLPKA